MAQTGEVTSNNIVCSKGSVGNHGDSSTDFLEKVFRILLDDGVLPNEDENSKVVDFRHPADLERDLDLTLGAQGTPDSQLLNMCRDTLKYCVRTGHRRFFNQLYGGQDLYGLAGSWLTETANTSQYTFEVAPVFTLVENEVLRHMAEKVGYLEYDGIFCPGGSIANMYGMNLARYYKFPDVKHEGMHALPRICIFTSKQAHYSVTKSAAVLGIGLRHIVNVPCNDKGQMDPASLDTAITQARDMGCTPFMVNAMSGTTVDGAYDPLDEIADVCERHGVWMHVDCCWGGGALMSRKYRHLLRGLERSDSMSWNPHKMMGAPLQCCTFLTRHKALLKECHCANATVLFQQDKFYDVTYDTGDKSLQCGRKVDAFKLWLMWKARGDLGFEQRIDNMFNCAHYLRNKLQTSAGFRLVFNQSQCTNVCFWYIPVSLRGLPEDADWWTNMSKVAPLIKERMILKGSLMIGYLPFSGYVNFFRVVISNGDCTLGDMDFIVAEIDRLGCDINHEDIS